MDKIYIIKYYNGEDYEDAYEMNWTFCETEDEADKLAEKLNDRLEKDLERYKYLDSNRELIYDKNTGNYSDSKESIEYQKLEHKYPYTHLSFIGDAGFYVEPLEKINKKKLEEL